MRTLNNRRLFLVLLLFFSQHSFAADYYWNITGSPTTYTSAISGCETKAASFGGTVGFNTPWGSSGFTSATSYKCLIMVPGQSAPTTVYVNRYGDSCPTGSTYNLTTGACDPPEPEKCEPTIGVEVEHRHRAGEFTGSGVIGARVDPPGSVCLDECQYAFSGTGPTDAYRFENADPNGVFLKFKYVGNGVSCSGNESDFAQPSDGTPTVEKQSDCTNKVIDAEGRQRYDCQATELNVDPGNMDCDVGTVGTELKCIPVPPSPKLTDKQVEQEITEKTNPDGSKDTTTTTTTTTTNCSGVNACSTSTSTTVTNNHTKADGTPGGESTTCTGTGCKDSDGKTQEEREEEEKEENPSKVTGGQTCDAPPSCEGDAVQCQILKQQYEARCDFEESADFDGSKSDIEGLFEGEQFELESTDIQAPSFINSGTRFLPASCPPPEQISLTSNGGHTYSLKFDPLCSFASDFSFLIMAMMSIWCAVYVGRAFGGE